jgi:hypothetical protein
MIALALAALVGGAVFLALQAVAHVEVSVAIAGGLFGAVLAEAIRDTWRGERDRRHAGRRLDAMREQDALNRILGEHHRG